MNNPMNVPSNSHSTGPVPGTTRRNFLRTSAAAVSAAAVGSLELSRSAHAAGSDIIRVGMVGCGGRCAGAAAQAMAADPGVRLVAMCDIFMDRVEAKRQALKKARPGQVEVDDDHRFAGFDGYKKVIESVDVVLIANAAKFHPLHSMTAIQAGKHVFVEKPHAIDPAGLKLAAAACELARKKNLSIQSGLHSRHHTGYAETISRIQDGAIGKVVAIEENFLRAPYVVIPRKAGLTELEFQCSTQYHFTWLSGDDVVQSLVHNLDRASWVLGEETPVKAHGMGGRASMREEIYGNVFDHHAVVYECASGVRIYAFCRTEYGCYDEYSSIVLGSKGRASILACQIWGENNWRWEGRCDPYQVEHDKLFAAIRSGKPINSGAYMIPSTATGIMGQISCYTGQELTREKLMNSDFHYPPRPEDCHDGMEPPVKPGPDGSYPVYIPGRTKLI